MKQKICALLKTHSPLENLKCLVYHQSSHISSKFRFRYSIFSHCFQKPSRNTDSRDSREHGHCHQEDWIKST